MSDLAVKVVWVVAGAPFVAAAAVLGPGWPFVLSCAGLLALYALVWLANRVREWSLDREALRGELQAPVRGSKIIGRTDSLAPSPALSSKEAA